MVFRKSAQRDERELSVSDAVKDAVGHMVRQFADPMAFYRELVQNSIDADASAIDVRLRYDREERALSVSVSDDGAGMSLEIIERQLLVLFRSSKDKDPTKIGKFGVGFFSIFAVEPSLVRVDTSTGEPGAGLRLELRRDYTYEVTERPATRGTTLTLVLNASHGEARAFVERSVTALDRWCPYVAIALSVHSSVDGAEVSKRMDRPFDQPEEGVLHLTEPQARFALQASERPIARFYKRGILLYETGDVLVQGVSIRVESNALMHTVSRDNIRRDNAFDQIVRSANRIARDQLAPLHMGNTVRAMCDAWDGKVCLGEQAASRAAKLLQQLCAMLGPDAPLPLPLCHSAPDEAVRIAKPSSIRYWANHSDALTAGLAMRGESVLAAHALGDAHEDTLRGLYGAHAIDVHEYFICLSVLSEDSLDDDQTVLLHRVRALLAEVGIASVYLVRWTGVGAERLYCAVREGEVDASDRGVVLAPSAIEQKLFALLRNRACMIHTAHRDYLNALKLAKRDPALAALTLSRLLVVHAEKLDARRDRALFEAFVRGETGR